VPNSLAFIDQAAGVCISSALINTPPGARLFIPRRGEECVRPVTFPLQARPGSTRYGDDALDGAVIVTRLRLAVTT